MLDTLKSVLDETDISIKDIRKEALEFQREVLQHTEYFKQEKINAETIINFRLQKIKNKENQIEKLNFKK